jgi:hypothetical protein
VHRGPAVVIDGRLAHQHHMGPIDARFLRSIGIGAPV